MKKQYKRTSEWYGNGNGDEECSTWQASLDPAADGWKAADHDRRQEGFEEEPLGYQQYGHEPYEDPHDNAFDRKYGENWRLS